MPMQLTIFDALLADRPHSSCGKTYRASSAPKTTPSVPSWADWSGAVPPLTCRTPAGPTRVWLLGQSDTPRGGYWMPNSSAWRNDGGASLCSLAAVLEAGPVPTRFYLSARACKGILRRAEKSGKQLPPSLHLALESVAFKGSKRDDGEWYVPEVVGTLSDGAHMGGGVTGRTPTQAASLPSLANTLTQRMHKGINTTCDEGQTLIPMTGGGFDCYGIDEEQNASVDVVAHAVPIMSFQQSSLSGKGTLGVDGDTHVLRPVKPQSDHQFVAHTGMAVRRLTPVECARLQGFPDDYLDITYRGKPAADGNKYKALGNSMAVPVMRWIGERIALVEEIP